MNKIITDQPPAQAGAPPLKDHSEINTTKTANKDWAQRKNKTA